QEVSCGGWHFRCNSGAPEPIISINRKSVTCACRTRFGELHAGERRVDTVDAARGCGFGKMPDSNGKDLPIPAPGRRSQGDRMNKHPSNGRAERVALAALAAT